MYYYNMRQLIARHGFVTAQENNGFVSECSGNKSAEKIRIYFVTYSYRFMNGTIQGLWWGTELRRKVVSIREI